MTLATHKDQVILTHATHFSCLFIKLWRESISVLILRFEKPFVVIHLLNHYNIICVIRFNYLCQAKSGKV